MLKLFILFSCVPQLNLNGEQITEGEATSTDAEFLADIMEQYEEIASSDEKKVKTIQAENKGVCLVDNLQ